MNRILIAYYSRRGFNYVSGNIENLAIGNTERVATRIRDLTDGHLLTIQTARPYSADYHVCTEEAQRELQRNIRPKLLSYDLNISEYGTVILGYPNWWGTMPMCLFTFLESHNFTDKTILPFCTHEGSGLGRSEADIAKLCPDAEIRNGLAIRGSEVTQSDQRVKDWLHQNQLL